MPHFFQGSEDRLFYSELQLAEIALVLGETDKSACKFRDLLDEPKITADTKIAALKGFAEALIAKIKTSLEVRPKIFCSFE